MKQKKEIEEVWVSVQEGSASAGSTASHILRSLQEGKIVKIQYASSGKSADALVLKSVAIQRIMRRMLNENNSSSGRKDTIVLSLPYRDKVPAKGDNDSKISVNVIDVTFIPKEEA